MSGPVPALEQALALYRAPTLLQTARQQALPSDLIELIRVVAGDEQAVRQGAVASGQPPEKVSEAATFYVQQVLFAPGADSYRVLGANPDAPDARIKEHYRWLVRWLHPDRNPDEWDAIYADRVNRAWQDLRHPERRAAYDQQMTESHATEPVAAQAYSAPFSSRPRISAEPPVTPTISGRMVRRLPIFVLGGLGVLAGAALTLMWFTQDPAPLGEEVSLGSGQVDPPAALVAAIAPPVSVPPSDSPRIEPTQVASGFPSPAASSPEMSAPAASRTRVVAATAAPGVAPEAALAPAAAPPAARQLPPQPHAPSNKADAVSSRPAVRDLRPVSAPVPPAPVAEPSEALTGKSLPQPSPTVVSESEAQAVLAHFRSAYAEGDINALMRLFTSDARNNRGGRDAIVYDYQSLFSSSESRELRLWPTGWIQRDQGATVVARYEARVKGNGRRLATTSRGEIRFDLRQEDGVLRIREVRHDEG